jgi:hypothetical protein
LLGQISLNCYGCWLRYYSVYCGFEKI